MKTFFASLLGTLAGMLLLVVGGGLTLFVIMIATAALNKDKAAPVEAGSYLVFDLATNLTDAPAQFDDSVFVAALSGNDVPDQLQTRLVTRALAEAARDDRIKGVLLKGSFAPAGYGTSYATLQEVRAALLKIKAAGKPIQAYLQYPDTRDFYFASVADNIALDPNGAVLMPGLASEPTFMAGLFDKFGIGVQVARVGKYKSAVETYTRRDFSPENREQLEALLGDIWQQLRDDVATSRGLSSATLQQLIDDGEAFLADDVLKHGLVDRLIYTDELLAELKKATGVDDPAKPFTQVSLKNYIAQMDKADPAPEEQPVEAGSESGRVAVIYAEGAIVDGQGSPTEVGGAKFAREIRKLRQDPKVKAIVLRVNSPGGSATASDQIDRELRLAAARMPVVVSMGGYAASGGYWISTYGTHIFAEPTTITGSIGVFGLLFNVQDLGHSVGLSWDVVKTGRFADAISASRPKTEAEMALFQRSTDTIYEKFIQKVAEGRKLEPARVREIAQGRVWSGVAAQQIGLVDEIGGLADAIAYAAQAAHLEQDFRVSEYPQKKDFAEVLAEALNKLAPGVSRAGLVKQVTARVEASLQELEQFNDPQGLYARLPVDLILN